MRKALSIISVIAIATLLAAACKSSGSSGGEVIKSTTVDGTIITLASNSGELRAGENDLLLSFADTSGKPVEITAASLTFHMPAMGSMPEMNNAGNLTTTDTPGKFRARANIEMSGTWEAQIRFEGPKGSGRTSMTVNAK